MRGALSIVRPLPEGASARTMPSVPGLPKLQPLPGQLFVCFAWGRCSLICWLHIRCQACFQNGQPHHASHQFRRRAVTERCALALRLMHAYQQAGTNVAQRSADCFGFCAVSSKVREFSVACPIFVDTPFSSCFHQRLSVADFNLWMLGGLTPLLNRVNDMGGLSLGPCFPALGLGPQSEDSELSSFLRSSQAFFRGWETPVSQYLPT